MGSLVRLRPRHSTDYVTQSRTVLATARDGTIDGRDGHGLFVHETRVLSCLRYRVNGALPATVALSNVEQHSWLAYYTAPAPDTRHAKDSGSGQMTSLSEETTEIRVSRSVGRGMHEDLDVVNFTGRRAEFELAVELDADFADLVEAGDERRQHGSLDRAWRASDRGGTLTFHYRARHEYDHQGDRGTKTIDRGIAIHVASASSAPRYADGALRFAIALDPGGAWHTCLLFAPWIEDVRLRPTRACYAFGAGEGAFGERRAIFLREATGLTSPEHATLTATAHAAFEQAKRDLAALRLYDLDHGDRAWTLAAGVPLYVALFGRDTLTTAWQAALAGPELMHGTLAELEKWQGTRVDDWRDEQPGRMLHEAHTGPLEVLNFNPRERYYGSVTSAALYPVVLGELWHWTGREDLVRPFVRPALDGLRWLDEWSDRDHDGFYDYLTRSTQGVKNQGWKDSGDAIVHADGRIAEPPIATATQQGYVYGAKTLMAELLWWLGEAREAERLYADARALKRRFNDVLWMDDERYVPMGLDRDGRPIRSIGSGGGHAIATGILDDDRVRAVADRLLASDMFSGWGIRTLSSDHPRYDPYSYHRGSVWPAEQAAFALGFFRYGLYDHLERLARAQIESTQLFDHFRLPEVFSGHPRDATHPFPAFYPKTNAPQAWSASSMFCLFQALLGIYPYAPLKILLIDPHLPEWLPRLTLERLRVGEASVTLRFTREADGTTRHEVLETEGTLHVVLQPSPWSLTSGFGERLKDALLSLLPGR